MIIHFTSYLFSIYNQFLNLSVTKKIADNDLHASDGRDTEALNCKPITNL
jgi:hypothetical protein